VQPVDECAECTRLWNDYAGSTHRLFKLKGKARIAALAHDRAVENSLAQEMDHAERDKVVAWRAFLRHVADAHQEPLEQKGPPSLHERERELRTSLDEARAAFLRVVAGQKDLMRDIPSGLPHPDGTARLERAALLRDTAYRRYLDAKTALESFLKSQKG
jgi:hypothetical protein